MGSPLPTGRACLLSFSLWLFQSPHERGLAPWTPQTPKQKHDWAFSSSWLLSDH